METDCAENVCGRNITETDCEENACGRNITEAGQLQEGRSYSADGE